MVKILGPLGSHDASGKVRAPPVYSSSLRNRHARYLPTPPAPPITGDYQVLGVLSPDASGYYNQAGTHNGQPYYAHVTGPWLIWCKPQGNFYFWFINQQLDLETGLLWLKWALYDPTPYGVYSPNGGATGNATFQQTPP